MGRFYQTSNLPLVNFAYQAPVELMQQAIQFDNQIRNSALDQSEKINDLLLQHKHLNTEAENQLAKNINQSYDNQIESLTGLAYNSTDYKNLYKGMSSLARQYKTDKATGTIFAQEQRYNQYQTYLKDNQDRIKENPLLADKILREWTNNVDSNVSENPNYIAPSIEKIEAIPDFNKLVLDIVKELKPDKYIWQDGQGGLHGLESLSKEDLDLVWNTVFQLPESQRFIAQQYRHYMPGYTDENGNPLTQYIYVDEQGNVIDMNNVSKQDLINGKFKRIPNLNSNLGRMIYGSYAHAYNQEELKADPVADYKLDSAKLQHQIQRDNIRLQIDAAKTEADILAKQEKAALDREKWEYQKAHPEINTSSLSKFKNKSTSTKAIQSEQLLSKQLPITQHTVVGFDDFLNNSIQLNSGNAGDNRAYLESTETAINDFLANQQLSTTFAEMYSAFYNYKHPDDKIQKTPKSVLNEIKNSPNGLGLISQYTTEMSEDEYFGDSTAFGRFLDTNSGKLKNEINKLREEIRNSNLNEDELQTAKNRLNALIQYRDYQSQMFVGQNRFNDSNRRYIGKDFYPTITDLIAKARESYNSKNHNINLSNNQSLGPTIDIGDDINTKQLIINSIRNGEIGGIVTFKDEEGAVVEQKLNDSDILDVLSDSENITMTVGSSGYSNSIEIHDQSQPDKTYSINLNSDSVLLSGLENNYGAGNPIVFTLKQRDALQGTEFLTESNRQEFNVKNSDSTISGIKVNKQEIQPYIQTLIDNGIPESVFKSGRSYMIDTQIVIGNTISTNPSFSGMIKSPFIKFKIYELDKNGFIKSFTPKETNYFDLTQTTSSLGYGNDLNTIYQQDKSLELINREALQMMKLIHDNPNL